MYFITELLFITFVFIGQFMVQGYRVFKELCTNAVNNL